MTPIDWELLTRYVSGECTPFERARVDRWLGESPDHGDLMRALHEIAADGSRGLSAERKSAMLAAIKRQPAQAPAEISGAPLGVIRADEPAKRRFTLPQRSRWSAAGRVAAMALVVAGAALGTRAALRLGAPADSAPSTAAPRIFTTAPGQRLALRLPDGTLATLAPASVLRLSADYGTRERVVDLEGEAVFTVVHDSVRPFAVRTARGLARDLGTRFAVRAYPGDPAAEVVVAEGLVAVLPDTAAAQGDSVVLTRGERARITADRRLAISRGVPLDPYFDWTAGQLVFRDTPLREAVVRLSRWYDIDVRLGSTPVGNRLLTATFDEEPAGDVLTLIAATLKLRLTAAGRTYTLHAK